MKGGIEVVEAGILMSVQDAGRFGFRKYGVPISGALDAHSFRLANWLVENESGATVIEMTLQGGTFEFHQEARVGVTGAESEVLINGDKAVMNKTLFLECGDMLTVGRAKAGCRSYLAIGGKWTLDKAMGSYSTCLSAGFGGLEGRVLQKGDRIFWENTEPKKVEREIPKELVPHFATKQTLRIVEGPEWGSLSSEQQSGFLESTYHISSESNRMGLRLKGQNALTLEYPEMKSAPVVPGIIQLPKSGEPIILMHDAQSVGGYPRIAKVADADLWRAAQLWSGNEIRFKIIDKEESIQLSAYFDNLVDQVDTI